MPPQELPCFSDITAARPDGGLFPQDNYLKSILETIADGVVVTDAHGLIRMVNPAVEKILGYAEEEIAGRSVGMLLPEHILSGREKDAGKLRETQARHKSGRTVPVEISVTEMRNGDIHAHIGIIRDITARKKAEEERQRHLKELEASNRELDDFAHIVSHDLRDPLRGLQSFARLLMDDPEHPLSAEQREKVETIFHTAQRMEGLLDALLYYSRLGKTALCVGETDLNIIVRNVIDMHAIRIKETGAVIEVPQHLPAIVCDQVRMTEVFHNLICNALRYSDAKGNRIEIGVAAGHPRAAGEPAFYVRDHGIG
ncbi:MAG: PAS domain S-box protein, partial [Alphaproteobacteria bacterium]|nr:PAS domain S-box protein [Alphaproteobacteria bacterium]